MNCSKCGIQSENILHLAKTWCCADCSSNNLFNELKAYYTQREGKRILFVSNSIERLDEISTYILKDIDIFNLRNTMILFLAEGLPNLQYPVDIAYIDNDLVCEDWSNLIKFNNSTNIRWVNTDWSLHDQSLSTPTKET